MGQKAQCWDTIKTMPCTLSTGFLAALVDSGTGAAPGKAAKANQKVDNGLDLQNRPYEIPTEHWKALEGFCRHEQIHFPADISILGLITGRKSVVP